MKAFLGIALFLCAWPALPRETDGLVGDRGQAAQQLSLAENHFFLGENPKALEAYRKARELFLAAGDELGQGHTWKGEADVLLRLGDDYEALDAYRHARELYLAAGDELGQADTWGGEVKVRDRLGEEKEALEACEKAQQLFRAARKPLLAAKEQLRLGHAWYGEAEIIYRLSEDKYEHEKKLASHTEALYHYREARKLYLATANQRGQGNTWRGEADVYLRLGKIEDKGDKDRLRLDYFERALDAYTKARRLFIAAGDPEGVGDTWLGEEQVRAAMPITARSHWGNAIKAVDAAITNYQKADVASRQISTFLMKAEVEAALEVQMMLPLPIPIRVGPISVTISVDPVKVMKKLGMVTPQEKQAARSSEEAIRLHGVYRETGDTEADRLRREEVIRKAYDFLVTVRARQRGQTAEALRLAEEARSRVLLDLLAAPPEGKESASATDVKATREALEAQISQIDAQLRGALTLDQQTRLRLQRLQLELRWNAAGKRSLPQEPPLDTTAMQNLARETGPMLVYYVAESETWGFLIRPETAEIYARSITISRSDLEKKIGAFLRDLSNPGKEPGGAAQALIFRNLLIDPFIDRLPKSGPLVIVPHGPLHELPFEALRDAAGKQLFERWQISVAPSVSALAFARSHHAAPRESDSFFGLASGRGLNRTDEEIDEISRLFSSRQAGDATYQSYEKLGTQARHLVIATRGVHSEGSRTETYLEIEPTPGGHGNRLTAAEIATIPLQAELVTLAACDTSHGRVLLSDDRLDLTRSFLIAHAGAVLATRWKVPEDEPTSHFLADFYQAYRKGGPGEAGLRKDEALTEARRLSRERHEPAAVWAAWVLIGDAR